jgi:hypothetical protein
MRPVLDGADDADDLKLSASLQRTIKVRWAKRRTEPMTRRSRPHRVAAARGHAEVLEGCSSGATSRDSACSQIFSAPEKSSAAVGREPFWSVPFKGSVAAPPNRRKSLRQPGAPPRSADLAKGVAV